MLVAHVRAQVVGALEAAFAQLALVRSLGRVAHFDVALEHRLERKLLAAVRTRDALRVRVLFHVALEAATAAYLAAQVAHASRTNRFRLGWPF